MRRSSHRLSGELRLSARRARGSESVSSLIRPIGSQGPRRGVAQLHVENVIEAQPVGRRVDRNEDLDATSRARSYFGEYQPSSPSAVLLKDGEVVHFVHRHEIEGRSPDQIAGELLKAFESHCA